MTVIVTLLGMLLEIIGIFLSYNLKKSYPKQLRKSSLYSDMHSLDMASLGGGGDDFRVAKTENVQNEINEVVGGYNESLKHIINADIIHREKSMNYLYLILLGFVLQCIALGIPEIVEWLLP